MRLPLLIGALVSSSSVGWTQTNLLEQGDFSGGSPGTLPPAPWVVSKPKPNVNLSLETLPGSTDKRLWAHFADDSTEDSVILTQSFGGITSGRLSLSVHVERYAAAVWFLFGRNNLAAREDMLFTFKITTKGGFLAATPEGKISNTVGSKTFTFAPGQTYNLYCDFKPASDQSGFQIEIGQAGGGVIFSGKTDHLDPITAFSARTHGEDGGSSFYVTDLKLTASP